MSCLLQLFTAVLIASSVGAVPEQVDLGTVSYVGTELSNGITQWLGMRYAAPPVGDLRFMPPQDPPGSDEPQPADTPGKSCLGTNRSPSDTRTSEDCLFINVMAPTSAAADSSLPVYFYIQGGGFNTNSNPNINASGIIIAADMDLIVVSINYRVGPYGFISSEDQPISANNGLRDQRKALEWVQENIASFGGDPARVVIGGTSAGGASVVLHLTAENGTNRGLFRGAIASSPSFASTLTVKQSQYQYTQFATRLGCAVQDSLACLRNKTALEIQEQNFNIPLPGGAKIPLYQWLPVLDFDFITDYTYQSYKDGKFIRVPTIYGDDTNGGTTFAPKNASRLAQSNSFILDQYPTLSLTQLGQISDLYPNPNDTCPNSGCYWRQASNVYQEVRYMCPALHANGIMTEAGLPSYAYQYNVEDPEQIESGMGVPHTVDLEALIGSEYTDEAPESYKPGGINERATPVLQGYWTSFMRTLDPNKYREEGTAEWKAWGEGSDCQRLVFGTGGATEMVDIGDGLRTRCEYWVKNGVNMML